MVSGIYPKPSDSKSSQKGQLTYPKRYMVRTFPSNFINVQGNKNKSADKKIGTNF